MTHSTDTFFDGALVFKQAQDGYRFSIDAILLGAGTCAMKPGSILDIGCGVGVVGMVAAHHHPEARVIGVEIQPSMAQAARESVRLSALEARVQIIEGDVREIARGRLPEDQPPLEPFDLALINPPYHPAGRGLINPNDQRAAARHELHGTVRELLTGCRLLLKPSGLVRLIYPAAELPRLLSAVTDAGLKPVRLRPIHPFPEAPARLILLDARCSGRREMEIAPGLVLHVQKDQYHPRIQALLDGEPVVL